MTYSCPSCQTPLAPGSRFCHMCGTRTFSCPSCQTPLAPGSQFCHMCGIRLGGMPRLAKVARLLIALGWIACAIAWLLIVAVGAESVVITGPIIFLLGLATVIDGLALRHRPAWALGLAHCGICILFFALVNILDWPPKQARQPFGIIGTIYVAAMLPLSLWARHHRPPERSPWQCRQCGYLLYGLTEPRCPECGTPFEPALLSGQPLPPEAILPPRPGANP